MFQGNTDPYPYIAAAYMVGFLSIAGYTAWLVINRYKIKKLLSVLSKGIQNETK